MLQMRLRPATPPSAVLVTEGNPPLTSHASPLSQGNEARDAADEAAVRDASKRAEGAAGRKTEEAVEGASAKMAEEAGQDTAEAAESAGLYTDAGRKAKEAIRATGRESTEVPVIQSVSRKAEETVIAAGQAAADTAEGVRLSGVGGAQLLTAQNGQ